MSDIYVIWRDPETTMLEPVAKVYYSQGKYRLAYTEGALNSRFPAFPRMSVKDKTYSSSDLFPFFKSRIISERRPEFSVMLSWLDMRQEDYDPLELLSVSGGSKKTDNFRIIRAPQKTSENKYRIKFFVSGIAYLDQGSKERILSLEDKEILDYRFEANKNDENAVAILSFGDGMQIGYYPKYLNEDLKKLIDANLLQKRPEIRVVKVNPEAPEQYRLLCETMCDWPQGFAPFESPKYQSISKD